MKIDIYQGETIQVASEQFSLRGEIQSDARYQVRLFQDNKFILEWKLAAILLSNKIALVQQDLPIEIANCRRHVFLKFTMNFGTDTIIIKFKPFKVFPYSIYLNDQKVAHGFFPKKFTAGYRQFRLETTTQDEISNLYIGLAFLLNLLPV